MYVCANSRTHRRRAALYSSWRFHTNNIVRGPPARSATACPVPGGGGGGGGNLFLVYCGQILMFGKEHPFEKYNGTSTHKTTTATITTTLVTYTIIIITTIIILYPYSQCHCIDAHTFANLRHRCCCHYLYIFFFLCLRSK